MQSPKMPTQQQIVAPVDYSKAQQMYNSTQAAGAAAKGFGSTIMTSGQGDPTQANIGKKAQLGV